MSSRRKGRSGIWTSWVELLLRRKGGYTATDAKLPIRPVPAHDESLAGYLARVMILNGYGAPLPWNTWFHVKQPLAASVQGLGLDVEAVAGLIGALPARQRINVPMQMAAADLNRHRCRWCPYCLREGGRYLGVWSLKLFAVCPIHACYLVDRCHVCNRATSLSRIGLAQCECGARLHEAATERASPTLVWIARRLVLAVQGSGNCHDEPFAALRIVDWLRLIRFLGPFGMELRPSRPGQLANAHELTVASEILAGSGKLLYEWPTGFHLLLTQLMQSGPPDSSLQRTFNPLYGVIYDDLAGSQFQFVRDAFENFLAEHWWGLLCRRNRRLRALVVDSRTRRTVAEACEQAGTTPRQLDWLIETGQVEAARFRSSRGRLLTAVSSDDLHAVASMVKDLLDLRTASRELGLSRERVRQLIDAEILPAMRRSPTTPWMIKRADLIGLIERCYAAPRAENVERVALGAILKHWRLPDEAAIALIRAFARGDLPILPCQDTTNLANLLVDRMAVRRWCKRQPLCPRSTLGT